MNSSIEIERPDEDIFYHDEQFPSSIAIIEEPGETDDEDQQITRSQLGISLRA